MRWEELIPESELSDFHAEGSKYAEQSAEELEVQRSQRHLTQMRWGNLVILVVLFIGITMLSLGNRTASSVPFEIFDDTFTLTFDGESVSLPLDKIREISIQSCAELGESAGNLAGEALDAKADACILLVTEQGSYAFSYESDATTRQLYSELLHLIEHSS